MKRIAPGVYDDGAGSVHLDVPELLEANGFADTPENRDQVAKAAQQMFAGTDTTVEIDEGGP